MGESVDRAGTFHAEVISYGMKEYESGSASVDICFRLTAWWHAGEEPRWHDWTTYGQEVYGHFFVIKSDGQLNPTPIKQLIQHLGWDGSFDSISDGTWEPTPCQVVVKEDTYKGETQMKADWLASYDAEPNLGMETLSTERSKTLQMKFGGQLRVIAGNVTRQTNKPATPPPQAPVAKPSAPMQDSQDESSQGQPSGDFPGIPY